MFSFIVTVLGLISVSFWVFALGFFLQIPGYTCTDPDGQTATCTEQQICAEDSVITDWQIDWESERTFNNWRVKFDLTCASDIIIALPGMCYFIGWTLSTFWLPSLSDIFGRRMFVLGSIAAGMALHLGIFFT